MLETWKPVKGYEGLYEVSDRGRVKSLEREVSFKSKNQFGVFYTEYKTPERILSPIMQSNGYWVVGLGFMGKRKIKSIHRLVAEAFIENPDNKPQVNHIDGNKGNNNASNLEWATPSENTKHAYKTALLTHYSRAVYQIDPETIIGKRWESVRAASRALGITESGIIKCCRGERKMSGGYIWRYCDGEN